MHASLQDMGCKNVGDNRVKCLREGDPELEKLVQIVERAKFGGIWSSN